MPVFIIPKKEGTVRFITYYQNLNHKIIRNPYALAILGETMKQLELFQYAKALDLNMGYYTINLSPISGNLTTIVTEFGQFRYNMVSMGLCTSGDIFQAKVDELIGDI